MPGEVSERKVRKRESFPLLCRPKRNSALKEGRSGAVPSSTFWSHFRSGVTLKRKIRRFLFLHFLIFTFVCPIYLESSIASYCGNHGSTNRKLSFATEGINSDFVMTENFMLPSTAL